jgi:D-sedoheptulose 7-phosphate isomerase
MNDTDDVASYFKVLSGTIGNLPLETVCRIADALIHAHENERTIYFFGNGGSAALACHLACDLGKGAVTGSGRKRFRAMSLTSNVPLMTAWANDSNYEDIFAEQLTNFVRPDDIAFAISGSGNSANVLRALRVARRAGALTLGLAGFNGGKMKELCDICVVVPSDNMQIIEDLHVCISHAVFSAIREKLCSNASAAFA